MSAHPGQQPPRAADVPEAVLAAIRVALEAERELEAARHRFGQHATYEDLRPFVFRCRDASQAGVAAIATALREAREQGARDKKQEMRGVWRFAGRCMAHLTREQIKQAAEGTGVQLTFCSDAALDAARAAEPEPPVKREDA